VNCLATKLPSHQGRYSRRRSLKITEAVVGVLFLLLLFSPMLALVYVLVSEFRPEPVTSKRGHVAESADRVQSSRTGLVWVPVLTSVLSAAGLLLLNRIAESPDCNAYLETILKLDAAVPDDQESDLGEKLNLGKAEQCSRPEDLLGAIIDE
jgi:ABC-type Fe3+ transport system permease subunit